LQQVITVPGCFGRALCFQPGSGTCDPCAARLGCAAKVAQELGVSSFYPSSCRPEPQHQSLEGVPVRVRLELDRLHNKGVTMDQLREDLRAGVNPMRLQRKPAFLSIALDQLLGDGLDSRSLQSIYRQRGMSPATARSNAAIVVGLLTTLGVCSETNGIWRVKPE
jgi:hypothetical protein